MESKNNISKVKLRSKTYRNRRHRGVKMKSREQMSHIGNKWQWIVRNEKILGTPTSKPGEKTAEKERRLDIYLHKEVSFRIFSNKIFNVCSSCTQTKLEPPLFCRIICKKYESIFFSRKKLKIRKFNLNKIAFIKRNINVYTVTDHTQRKREVT